MIDTNGSTGNILSAKSYFISELERGPVAPALFGEAVARYGIEKLATFLSDHLSEVVTVFPFKELSPVGRPAVALTARLRDPAYWQQFRLGSLCKAWDNCIVDMTALDRMSTRRHVQNVAASTFGHTFEIGKRFPGKILRRAYSSAGWIVEVELPEGGTENCFLPVVSAQDTFFVGMAGIFEVVNILPQKRSVLLRLVGQKQAEDASDVAEQTSASATRVCSEESSDATQVILQAETRLASAKRLYDAGVISLDEFSKVRAEALQVLGIK